MNYVYPEMSVRVPYEMNCSECHYLIEEGIPLKMYYEKLGGRSTRIGVRIHRFYAKCPECDSLFIFRSDLLSESFEVEHGAVSQKEDNKKGLKKKYPHKLSLDPWSLLKYYKDDFDTETLVMRIDDNLQWLREQEDVYGRYVDENWCEKAAENVFFPLGEKNPKHFVVWDDGKTPMSPFVKKLTKVQNKDLWTIFPMIREVLHTKMFNRMAQSFANRMQPLIDNYNHCMEEVLKEKKENEMDNLQDEPELFPFRESIIKQSDIMFDQDLNVAYNQQVMMPYAMKCEDCGSHFPKGMEFDMDQQIIGQDKYLIRTFIYRFYFNCPDCRARLIFRSNFQQNAFIRELTLDSAPGDEEDVYVDVVNDALDPTTLLKPSRKLNETELSLIQAFQNILDLYDDPDIEEYRCDCLLGHFMEEEKSCQKTAKYIAPEFITGDLNLPFSDVLQAIPKYHFNRFVHAFRKQINQFDKKRECIMDTDDEDEDEEEEEEEPTVAEKVKVEPKVEVKNGNGASSNTPPPVKEQKVVEPLPVTTPVEQPEAKQNPENPYNMFFVFPCQSKLLPPQLTTVPITIKCKKCSSPIRKGRKLVMRQEWLNGLRKLPVNVYRLYMRCPTCESHITLRSELIDQTYRPEYGAISEPDGQMIPETSSAAFDPISLIRRWPFDVRNAQETMDALEDEINKVLVEKDDSPTIGRLRDQIREELKPDRRHPDLVKVIIPDGLEMSMSPFVSYFITDVLDFYDMYVMRAQLRTEHFIRVLEGTEPEKPLFPIHSESPPASEENQTTLQNLLARYRPSKYSDYSNFFKSDTRKDTSLRRAELVERRRKELNSRNGNK